MTLARAILCCACRNVWFTRARRILLCKILPIESFARSRFAMDALSLSFHKERAKEKEPRRSPWEPPWQPTAGLPRRAVCAGKGLCYLVGRGLAPAVCAAVFLYCGGQDFLIFCVAIRSYCAPSSRADRIALDAASGCATRSGGRNAPGRSLRDLPRQPTRGSRVGLFVQASAWQGFLLSVFA